jgi:hypothetical protein
MAAKLAGLALLLCADVATAQQPIPAPPPTGAPMQRPSDLAPISYSPPSPYLPSTESDKALKERMHQQEQRATGTSPPSAGFHPTAMQQRGLDLGPIPYVEQPLEYGIPLTPPGQERLFLMETEASLKERMRQEAKNRGERDALTFPDEPVLTTEAYAGRDWPERKMLIEPDYVCYHRLLFEQINVERYGWDLGPLSVPIETGKFLSDLVLLPYNLGKDPCRTETSAGYCLPGDSVPFLIYPPEWSLTGAITEAGVVVALFAMFP